MQGARIQRPTPPQGGGAIGKYLRDLDDYARRVEVTEVAGGRLKRNGRGGTTIINEPSRGGGRSQCPGGIWG